MLFKISKKKVDYFLVATMLLGHEQNAWKVPLFPFNGATFVRDSGLNSRM